MGVRARAYFVTAIALLAVASLACSHLPDWMPGSEPPPRIRLRVIDGLDPVSFPAPGRLELRQDHRIGSYDAILIPEVTISYRRGSLELSPAAERAFLERMRETLVEATEDARIPVMTAPGACTMEVRLRVSRMEVDVGDRADQLAAMTLVMLFRDSETRRPLLRYVRDHLVPNPSEGVSHDDQIRKGLRRIIDEMNIATPFRESGYADQPILPQCQGTLAARGRAAVESQTR